MRDSVRLKVSELRERYDRDEVHIERVERPRSGEHIHAPTPLSHIREAWKSGDDFVSSVDLDTVLWELDEDETVEWLTGSVGKCRLQVGNTAVWVVEKEDK